MPSFQALKYNETNGIFPYSVLSCYINFSAVPELDSADNPQRVARRAGRRRGACSGLGSRGLSAARAATWALTAARLPHLIELINMCLGAHVSLRPEIVQLWASVTTGRAGSAVGYPYRHGHLPVTESDDLVSSARHRVT